MSGPTSELAHRLATRRQDLHRQQVNAVFYDLEQRLDSWRQLVRVTRRMSPNSPHRIDICIAYAAHGLASATARLVDLGEN